MVIVLKIRFDDFNNGEELLKKNTVQWKKARRSKKNQQNVIQSNLNEY